MDWASSRMLASSKLINRERALRVTQLDAEGIVQHAEHVAASMFVVPQVANSFGDNASLRQSIRATSPTRKPALRALCGLAMGITEECFVSVGVVVDRDQVWRVKSSDRQDDKPRARAL